MVMKRLTVMNFRTFEKLDLKLGNLNIFIGANVSGINFPQTLRFFRDLTLCARIMPFHFNAALTTSEISI